MPTETIVVLVSDEGDTIDRIVRTVCGGTGRKADSAIIISLGRNLNLNPPAKFVTIEELPNAIKETKGDFRIEIESHGLPDSLALLSSGGSISGSELELRLGKAFKDVDIDCMSRCIGVYAPICYSADQSNSTEKKSIVDRINGSINKWKDQRNTVDQVDKINIKTPPVTGVCGVGLATASTEHAPLIGITKEVGPLVKLLFKVAWEAVIKVKPQIVTSQSISEKIIAERVNDDNSALESASESLKSYVSAAVFFHDFEVQLLCDLGLSSQYVHKQDSVHEGEFDISDDPPYFNVEQIDELHKSLCAQELLQAIKDGYDGQCDAQVAIDTLRDSKILSDSGVNINFLELADQSIESEDKQAAEDQLANLKASCSMRESTALLNELDQNKEFKVVLDFSGLAEILGPINNNFDKLSSIVKIQDLCETFKNVRGDLLLYKDRLVKDLRDVELNAQKINIVNQLNTDIDEVIDNISKTIVLDENFKKIQHFFDTVDVAYQSLSNKVLSLLGNIATTYSDRENNKKTELPMSAQSSTNNQHRAVYLTNLNNRLQQWREAQARCMKVKQVPDLQRDVLGQAEDGAKILGIESDHSPPQM